MGVWNGWGYGIAFFRALKFQSSEPENWPKFSSFCGIRGIFLQISASDKYFSGSGKWPFHTPPVHTPTKLDTGLSATEPPFQKQQGCRQESHSREKIWTFLEAPLLWDVWPSTNSLSWDCSCKRLTWGDSGGSMRQGHPHGGIVSAGVSSKLPGFAAGLGAPSFWGFRGFEPRCGTLRVAVFSKALHKDTPAPTSLLLLHKTRTTENKQCSCESRSDWCRSLGGGVGRRPRRRSGRVGWWLAPLPTLPKFSRVRPRTFRRILSQFSGSRF